MIDGCIVINLLHRTDRLEQFWRQQPIFSILGINPERLEGVYGKNLAGYGQKPWFRKRLSVKRANAWAGKAGCTLSHRKAIERAKELGWKNVLVLEDDCLFEPSISSQWAQFQEAVKSLPEDWIAVYLYGHHAVSPVRMIKTYSDTTCFEICGASSTTAYLLNGTYFETVLKLLPTTDTIWKWTARYKTIDRWYSRKLFLLGRIYALSPFGVRHLGTSSDITTTGDSDNAPSFEFRNSELARSFDQARRIKCFQHRIALAATWFRCAFKSIKGL
jgi:GR25 family glycosyltransferase involved in LPS biosynthesis